MSYSRWTDSYWYTYWCYQDSELENRDTAILSVCGVVELSAKQLRDDLSGCMDKVNSLDPGGDLEELQVYVRQFLRDVDDQYGAADRESDNKKAGA